MMFILQTDFINDWMEPNSSLEINLNARRDSEL